MSLAVCAGTQEGEEQNASRAVGSVVGRHARTGRNFHGRLRGKCKFRTGSLKLAVKAAWQGARNALFERISIN